MSTLQHRTTRHELRAERIHNRRVATEARTTVRDEIEDGLNSYLSADEAAAPAPTAREIARAHAEALSLNAMAAWERELLLMSDLDQNGEMEISVYYSEVDDLLLELDAEERRAREARWDSAYGGYPADLPLHESDSAPWIPYASSMEEVRDIFGGTDFIVTHDFRDRRVR